MKRDYDVAIVGSGVAGLAAAVSAADAETRVIGGDERPIPGLFAAGETVGSLHGDRYIGGGGSFGPCVAFGKLAGEKAAATAFASESG